MKEPNASPTSRNFRMKPANSPSAGTKPPAEPNRFSVARQREGGCFGRRAALDLGWFFRLRRRCLVTTFGAWIDGSSGEIGGRDDRIAAPGRLGKAYC